MLFRHLPFCSCGDWGPDRFSRWPQGTGLAKGRNKPEGKGVQGWGARTDHLKDSVRARGCCAARGRGREWERQGVEATGAEPRRLFYRKTKSALLISFPQRLFFRMPPLPTTAHFLN